MYADESFYNLYVLLCSTPKCEQLSLDAFFSYYGCAIHSTAICKVLQSLASENKNRSRDGAIYMIGTSTIFTTPSTHRGDLICLYQILKGVYDIDFQLFTPSS